MLRLTRARGFYRTSSFRLVKPSDTEGGDAPLTLQPEDEAALVLRVRLDVRHERAHALLKHGSVGQGPGPEPRQDVRGALLEAHLLQGALHRRQSLFPAGKAPSPEPPLSQRQQNQRQTVHFNLRSEAVKPKSNPSILLGPKKDVKF